MDEGFTNKDGVKSTLLAEYGLETDKITPLGSYFNINYIVKVRNVGENIGETRKCLVKIFNVTNASYFKNAELQYAMMRHLHANNIGASVQIPTLTGEVYVKVDEKYMFQLLTFLPGQSVTEAKVDAEELNQILLKVGVHIARYHVAAKTLPYKNMNSSPDFPFRPENALQYLCKLSYVERVHLRETIEQHMEVYKKNFLTRTNELRKGFIHGDFSDANVIINRVRTNNLNSTQDEWNVSGVIDFEHCHYSYFVADLGISIAYFLTKSVSTQGSNIIEAAKKIIMGYESVHSLTTAEKEVLFDVVASRLGLSYISGCYESYLHPERRDVIMLQSQYMPKVFGVIDTVGRSEIEKIWFGER